MTDYRKQIYDHVKHGYQLGTVERSAICMMFEDIDKLSAENLNLKAQIQYLETQLRINANVNEVSNSYSCLNIKYKEGE